MLANFRAARERIAAMVRDAPNETLAGRYQQGLVEFDQALATIREHIEALGLTETPSEPVPAGRIACGSVAEAETPVFDEALVSARGRSRVSTAVVWMVVLLLGAGCGGWLYWQYEDRKLLERIERVALLEKQGAEFIENRRWPEAVAIFDEVDALTPGSEIARFGRRGIEAGMAEEQNQFIGYWTGEARAALDSGRWDDAESAARQVIDRFPDNSDARDVLAGIDAARHIERRNRAIEAVLSMIDRGEIDEALDAAAVLAKQHPGDAGVADAQASASAARERAEADLSRARDLLAMAVERDTGAFDAEALEWLREAALLAPRDEAIAAHLEKMASYSRTLRVPEDFADPTAALAEARDNDRILLAAGTWQGPLIVNLAIDIQGAGPAETIIECPAVAGSAITIGPDAEGSRISGITFRHLGFDAGEDRYSAALVRGGLATFADCHFAEASGHGLAVIEAGRVDLQRCRFRDNGWNGVDATGQGSVVNASECRMTGNFGHGVEVWNGAGLLLVNSQCEDNSRNGVHADTREPVRIEGCEMAGNREFGIVLTSGLAGLVMDNRLRNNLLGGMVVRHAAAGIRAEGNRILSNTGPGLILESGIDAIAYRDNSVTRNTGRQIVTDVDLSQPDEGAGPVAVDRAD